MGPLVIANIVETLKNSGIDLASMLARPSNTGTVDTNSQPSSQTEAAVYETA
jgi:hypothetical protein